MNLRTKQAISKWVLGVLSTGLAVTAVAAADSDVQAQHLRMLKQFDHDLRATNMPNAWRVNKLHGEFERLFPKLSHKALHGLRDTELSAYFQAQKIDNFYRPDRAAVRELRTVFEELETRNPPHDAQRLAMYAVYIAQRDFIAAASLAHNKPIAAGYPRLPEIIDHHVTAVGQQNRMMLDGAGQKLEITPIAHPHAQIIVIAHPQCHFSQAAIAAIRQDEALARVFKAHSLWLAPPDGNLDIDAFVAWNQQYPDEPLAYLYAEHEWGGLEMLSTPIFYFMLDGAVIGQMMGWPIDDAPEKS